MESYFYKKSKYYYEMFLNKKPVKKVCAIIKNEDKFLVLVKNGKCMNVGGSVDGGETNLQAVKREVMEEANAVIKDAKYLTKIYYSVDWEFEGKKFKSLRVEYFYLCSLENDNINIKGLEGEFDDDVVLEWHTVEELEKLKLNKFELDLVKRIK